MIGDKLVKIHHLEPLIDFCLSEKDMTKGSYDLYDIILKQYVSYLKERKILYAKTEDIILYRDRLMKSNYSISWIYITINTIKGFYRYLSLHQRRLGIDEINEFNAADT
ncbi:MAG: hypothetical protein A2Y45_00410 [Tenericutes bacterium GWC2_34_14]|nr:MAG: hypothetical protein A2Y45_00410 [Tenericutes bacterium GWC2_34_14]OHE34462.1 MAG: hypothetical protein A2012_08030 [Tenericutes bacterium GWE2_34_108]OHE35818.1 MAG: hypothetical protein A2Y46_02735 [Tenericutes bacterium GWF1_35_14]OHE42838.1 MAG: hypothetical protein A2221_09040 [Tenericutes bacterium RIFOXYA2_FULL_36_32]OHE46066.1 MAG: hypothetical protein A2308_00710 [Tenericutes bacterium RIFOXYB2_FULL_36_25]OHE50021.1 MAG: hypothetical protein A2518_03805 [Tenericutes bacterium 